jgi:Zn-dependent peptidase ImmA (M78 family)/DNA-binding XRE family transcriptional regulator
VPEIQKQSRIFNADRMHLARKRKGLSKTEFARKVGVDLRSLYGYEQAHYTPSDETLSRMEEITGFPGEFFFGDDIEILDRDVASFRGLSRMAASQREMALSQGSIALLLNDWLEERFELPKPDLPDLRHEPNPEAAATTLRYYWRLGELPINNVIHLLEEKGVRVFSLAINTRDVDAFSLWKDSTPFVFLNTQKSSERSRHDAAHELGHLVMHKHGAPQGREAEAEADAFASSFLMPSASVLAHAPRFLRPPTLASLTQAKRIWTTSLASLNYRLHAVGLLSDWQNRMLCMQIAKHGYRTREPNSAPREVSQVLAKVFASLSSEGISRSQIAKELAVPKTEIEQLIFGLAISSVEGGGKSTGRQERPKLQLVG